MCKDSCTIPYRVLLFPNDILLSNTNYMYVNDEIRAMHI